MGNGKIQLGTGEVLLDLTSDTVTASDLLLGVTAHGKDGEPITGTIEPQSTISATINTEGGSVIIPAGVYTADGSVTAGSSLIIPTGTREVTLSTSGTRYNVRTYYYFTPTFAEGIVQTNSATAAATDIYNGKTAYVNGEKLTGTYKLYTTQVNSGSSGSSTSQLVVSCSFEPSAVAVVYNNGTYTNNKIIACFGISNGISWQSKTSSGCAFTAITENVGNYWYYSSGKVYIKAPPSTYTWASNNYRVFCFR